MKKNIFYDTGFTLIELLVSIALMAIIGTITVTIISSVLRSSNKTTLAGNIRQSGNYVLEQVSDTARYATGFKVGNAADTGSLNPGDATTYTQDCSVPVTSHSIAFANSADDKERIFYCDLTTHTISYQMATDVGYSTAGFSPLVDTNVANASAVNVASCSFTCSQASASSPATIGITFTLTQNGSGNFPENNVNLQFSNSTLMRNINF